MKHLLLRYSTYSQLVTDQQDSYGFLHVDRCDSTLWSGLLGAAGVPVDLTAARDSSGAWYRRPLSYAECYDCGGSKSTVSRDQLLGVLWWAWRSQRADVVEDLVRYARRHWWKMGRGVPSRTYASPALLSTAARVLRALGGPTLWECWLPAYFAGGQTGFTAHLQVLHLLLRDEVGTVLTSAQRDLLSDHAEREPYNPLFQYAAGNDSVATDLLLTEQWWPADRLPTSADRSEEWLPQRDYGPDWQPSTPGTTHSGGDLLFVAKLVLDRNLQKSTRG